MVKSSYINCGGSKLSVGSITWEADGGLNSRGQTFRTLATVGLDTLGETYSRKVYQSVRFFDNKEGKVNSYAIEVSREGYYWVRLYFAELLYRDVNLRSFNVSVEGAIVLEHYHPAKVMRGERKEFLTAVTDGSLDISFIRGPIGDPMISGIEVLPVDPGFYGLEASQNLVLGTVHRISCGADSVMVDSLGRFWMPDEGLFTPADSTFVLSTKLIDNSTYALSGALYEPSTADTAPDFHPRDVYQKLRSTLNGYENDTSPTLPSTPLSYFLEVAPGQEHLVRLGFAELLIPWESGRILNISVGGQQSASVLDLLFGCQFAEPCIKTVGVKSSSSGIIDISVGAGKFLGYTRDGILSSLEVFRVFTPEAVPMPQPETPPLMFATPTVWKGVWIGALSGTLFGVAFLVIVFLFLRRRAAKREAFLLQQREDKGLLDTSDSRAEESLLGTKGQLSSKMSLSLRSELYSTRTFSYKEVQHATRGFSEANVLGRGGFGDVYLGEVEEGYQVAVKRRAVQSKQGEVEFRAEVELLSRLHHRNLLGLRGYAQEAGHLVLVYDYMPNGTLHDYLRDKDRVEGLQWKQRLEIVTGAAKGLEYLHFGAKPAVIHRDVKSSNILLDASLNSKVADFGLSKIREVDEKVTEEPASHISTAVKGTPGYLDPAYYASQHLSEKSDVYSFGIVMLELLTGRLPIWMEYCNSGEIRTGTTQAVSLREWAAEHLARKDIRALTAPELQLSKTMPSIHYYAQLAWKCVSIKTSRRPTMADVVRGLEESQRLLDAELMASPSSDAGTRQSTLPNSEISVDYDDDASILT